MDNQIKDDWSAGDLSNQERNDFKNRLGIDKQKLKHRNWIVVTTIVCSLALIFSFLLFEYRILDPVIRGIKTTYPEKAQQAENNSPVRDEKLDQQLNVKSGVGNVLKPNNRMQPSASEPLAKDLAKSEKEASPETSNITIGWPIFALGSITLIAATTLLLGLARVTYSVFYIY